MFQVKFKEKVDIEDLVLASKPTGILNMETMDIKQEHLEQMSNTGQFMKTTTQETS